MKQIIYGDDMLMTITKRKRVVYCVVMTIVTTFALFIDINLLESGEGVVSCVAFNKVLKTNKLNLRA